MDCAKFIDIEERPTWNMIDTVQYIKEHKLLVLVNSINTQNQELFIKKIKFIFAVLKQAYEFRTWIIRKVL